MKIKSVSYALIPDTIYDEGKKCISWFLIRYAKSCFDAIIESLVL